MAVVQSVAGRTFLMFDMPYDHNGIDIRVLVYLGINRLEMPNLPCP